MKNLSVLLSIVLALAAQLSRAQSSNPNLWSVETPDREHLANVWWRSDLNSLLLEFQNSAAKGTPLAQDGDDSAAFKSMGRFAVFNLGTQVRLIAQWGPSAQYFVLITANQADNSRRPAATYLFSTKDFSLHQIGADSANGRFSSFTFLDAHTIRASIAFKSNSETDIDLDREVSSTPAIVPVKHGDWSRPASNTSTH